MFRCTWFIFFFTLGPRAIAALALSICRLADLTSPALGAGAMHPQNNYKLLITAKNEPKFKTIPTARQVCTFTVVYASLSHLFYYNWRICEKMWKRGSLRTTASSLISSFFVNTLKNCFEHFPDTTSITWRFIFIFIFKFSKRQNLTESFSLYTLGDAI